MNYINCLFMYLATAILVRLALSPVAPLGSIALDCLELVLGNRVCGTPHIVLYWKLSWHLHGWCRISWDSGGIRLGWLIACSRGFADSDFSPLSDQWFHLFGDRLRTGNSGDNMVAWGIVGLGSIRFFTTGRGCINMGRQMPRSGRITT